MVQKVRNKLIKKPQKKKIIKKRKEAELNTLVIDAIGNPFKIADPQSVIYGIKSIYPSEIESSSYENLLVAPRQPERINYWKRIAETIRSENDVLKNELGSYRGNFFKEFLSRGDHSDVEKDTSDPMDKSYLEYLEIEKHRFEDSTHKEEKHKLPSSSRKQNTELLFESHKDICAETPEYTTPEDSLDGDSVYEELMGITNYE